MGKKKSVSVDTDAVETPGALQEFLSEPEDVASGVNGVDEIRLIDVARIVFSPFNICSEERKNNTAELEASIKAFGNFIHHPIVRQIDDGNYEVVVGERRTRAAMKLGWDSIPAIERKLTDQEAKEYIAVENLQREGLSLMDEIQQVNILLEGGMPAKEVALRIGKPAKYVATIAAVANFDEKVWKILKAKDWVGEWTLSALEHLAGLETEIIFDIFRCLNYNNSPAAVKNIVANETKLLKRANWDLADEGLVPQAGSCLACPYRSSMQDDLFPDEEATATKAGKTERCLRPACWESKCVAWLESEISKQREKHGDVILIQDYGDYDRKFDGKTVGVWQVDFAKNVSTNTVPGIYVNGSKEGSVVSIKKSSLQKAEDQNGKAKKEKPTKPAADAPAKAQIKFQQEKIASAQERLTARRNAAFLLKTQEYIADIARIDLEKAVALVAAFGTSFHAQRFTDKDPINEKEKFDPWKVFDFAHESYHKNNVDAVAMRLYKLVLPVLNHRIEYVSGFPKSKAMEDAKKILDVLCVDAASILSEVHEEIPEPKYLAAAQKKIETIQESGGKGKKQKAKK